MRAVSAGSGALFGRWCDSPTAQLCPHSGQNCGYHPSACPEEFACPEYHRGEERSSAVKSLGRLPGLRLRTIRPQMAKPQRGRHGGLPAAGLATNRPLSANPRIFISLFTEQLGSAEHFLPKPLDSVCYNKQGAPRRGSRRVSSGREDPAAGGGTLQKSGSPPAKAARAGSAEESAKLSGVLPSTGSLQGPLFPPRCIGVYRRLTIPGRSLLSRPEQRRPIGKGFSARRGISPTGFRIALTTQSPRIL